MKQMPVTSSTRDPKEHAINCPPRHLYSARVLPNGEYYCGVSLPENAGYGTRYSTRERRGHHGIRAWLGKYNPSL